MKSQLQPLRSLTDAQVALKLQTSKQVKKTINWGRAKYIKQFRTQLGLSPTE
ncbi:hypothetical protein H6G97_43130 [Nostoc flagelliforme FACHB-838]|uniref:XRE family transcriptional regulator n=1 Tax=Nostoc flagelliforme FACHB-838 TaxID=2692904 RepID=A0ABR8E2I9_9NOSO|nr:hypothetical protein [Nostoc flagelliforme]MBD2535789.1 hypothetical protein [Nostoc flagelliforme FACHB-838]